MAERDLTTGPLTGHLAGMAVPAAFGMVATTLYNIVDVYYAGWVSTEALAGLSVSFSAFMMLMALGIGLNMGAGALIGSALGAKKPEEARNFAAGAIGAAAALGVLLAIVGWMAGDGLLRLMSVRGEVLELAKSYLFVLFCGLPAFLIGFTANGVLTAQGDTVSNTRAQMAALIVNCGLNPLMMYGAFGIEGLGFNGIAVSTVLIQLGVATFLVRRALKSGAMRGVKLGAFFPTARLSLDLLKQSAPASLNMVVMMVGGFLIQRHLQPFGAPAVAGFGVAFRAEQLILLPILAVSFAVMPMVAQNYGAKDHDRVRQVLTLAGMVVVLMSVIGAIILSLGGVALTRVFTDDPDAIASGAAYLRMAALMMPAYALMFVVTGFFQGVKRPIWSLVIGVYRQVFALAVFPTLFVLYTDWGLAAVWAGLFTAVWSGFCLAAFLTVRVARPAIGGLRLDFAGLRAAAA
ncbi:MAG: MATE family efflux transporter [Pseudomonadota bacterium]